MTDGSVRGGVRTQIITLAVDADRCRSNATSVALLLGAMNGVTIVERDPMSERLWVFTDGRVAPNAIVDVLAFWGFRVAFLDNAFELAA